MASSFIKNNIPLKITAALAMLFIPLPLLMMFDTAAFKEFSILRILLYLLISAVPISCGYLMIKIKKSFSKPKGIFFANILLGAVAVILEILTCIIIDMMVKAQIEFHSHYLVFGLMPSVLFWYFLGSKLYKRDFGEIFTFIWLGGYGVETVICYAFSAFMKKDIPALETGMKFTAYLLIVMSLITVLLINQSNLENEIKRRRSIGLILPKGIKLYNAGLISVVGVIILLGLLLKDYIAAGLKWFTVQTLRIIDFILSKIRFLSSETISPDDAIFPEGNGLLNDSAKDDIFVYAVVILACILIVAFHKKIFAFIKNIAQKIFGKLSVDTEHTTSEYDYTDSYEAIPIEEIKIKPETFENVLKKYRKEKDSDTKFRLGYKLYMMWLAKRDKNFKDSMTVSQHLKISEKLYHGEQNIDTIADEYQGLRYNDKSVNQSDSADMDKLISELYK